MSKNNNKKIHKKINGRLLQINKRFSQLKEKQRQLIIDLIRSSYKEFYFEKNKFPSNKIEKLDLINCVYEKIQAREIWIPFYEIKEYFYSKQLKMTKSILKELEKKNE